MLSEQEVQQYSRQNSDGTEKGVRLSWQDLSVYVTSPGSKIHKQLINNVRGTVEPGSLVAIIGGSGAGKSSLMGALAFRSPPGVVVDGQIFVNGWSVTPSYMRHHSGFMHQEDLFIGTMTVLEHLTFMARMKLDRRTPYSAVRQRINELLTEVGLAHRMNTMIGSGGNDKVLSGGEKKRLAFATELLTDPKLLFLDEPTTGLDANSASLLVSQLTKFASRGRSVLCTIHQPSSAIFNSFDRIILVADGRIAFMGTNTQALNFFASQGYVCPETFNPADFFVATLAIAPRDEHTSKRVAQRICDSFLSSDACKEVDLTLQLELHIAQAYNCLAAMAGLCFVGAITMDQLGVQAVQGVLFILVSENTFAPMYATLAALPQEFPLFLREYHAGMYSAHLYYIARVASYIPGLIVEPVLFVILVYWLAGLRATVEAFFLTLLVSIFTMNVSTACGCFFSAAFDSVPVAMAYLVPFDYILMVTMGPFIKLSSLPIYIQWIKYISWLLHSTEALTIVQWKGVNNISCEAYDPELPCMRKGEEVLERFDFDVDNFWTDISLMALIYIVFHVMGYICLWKRCQIR